jgi:hypothetical protein
VRHQYAHTPTRLGMLETVRAYAGERFAASAVRDAVDERHYRYYRALAQHHGTEQALCGRDGDQHLAQLDADIDNLHAALGWAVQEPDAARAAAMVAALGPYWRMRNRWSDALNWIDLALSIPGTEEHPEFQVQALCTKHLCLWPLGRGAEESSVLAEAEAIAATLADPVILSQTLQRRARVALDQSPAAAEAYAEQALRCATTAGNPWQIASASMEKAFTAPTITELRERVDQATALLDEVGNTYLLAAMLAGTPYVALCMGADAAARELADRALPIVRELGTPFQWMILCGNLGLAALMTGDTDCATHAFREQLTLCRELVVLPMAAEGLHGLGALAAVRGDDHRAARLAGAATAHRYNQPHDAFEVRLDATLLQPARARIGAQAWDAAIQQGIALSFEAAIADALGEPHT